MRDYNTQDRDTHGEHRRTDLITPDVIFFIHRTTRNKKAVLSFVESNTHEIFDLFSNVNLTWQRGERRGENHVIGTGGQFLPPKGGTFWKFWIKNIGHPPVRWSRAHRELKARLRGMHFSCKSKIAYDGKGAPYNKITQIERVNK